MAGKKKIAWCYEEKLYTQMRKKKVDWKIGEDFEGLPYCSKPGRHREKLLKGV